MRKPKPRSSVTESTKMVTMIAIQEVIFLHVKSKSSASITMETMPTGMGPTFDWPGMGVTWGREQTEKRASTQNLTFWTPNL